MRRPELRCICLQNRAAGHYLNLPVVESEGRLVGIVDVLKLTYATLEQVRASHICIIGTADAASPDRIHS
jgi:hypothetical protein